MNSLVLIERPDDVLVGKPFVFGVASDVLKGQLALGFRGEAAEGPEEELVYLVGIGARVLGHLFGPATRAG